MRLYRFVFVLFPSISCSFIAGASFQSWASGCGAPYITPRWAFYATPCKKKCTRPMFHGIDSDRDQCRIQQNTLKVFGDCCVKMVIDCGSYLKMWFTHRRKQTHACVQYQLLYGILQVPICIWSWDTNQLWIPGTVGWSFCGALRGQSPSKSPGKSTPTSAAAARRWNDELLETHSQMQRWDWR